MDRILIILKKENGPRASSVPALWLNTMIFQHVYWYMQRISGERLQDHWSSCLKIVEALARTYCLVRSIPSLELICFTFSVIMCLPWLRFDYGYKKIKYIVYKWLKQGRITPNIENEYVLKLVN